VKPALICGVSGQDGTYPSWLLLEKEHRTCRVRLTAADVAPLKVDAESCTLATGAARPEATP